MLNDALTLPDSFLLLLKNAGPVTRRKALRKAVTYLKKENTRRIKANVEPDGSRMVHRKQGSRRMFQSISKQIKRVSRGDNAEFGFYGRTGWVASNHQYGRSVKTKTHDIPLPVRELLGINDADQLVVRDIFLAELMSK